MTSQKANKIKQDKIDATDGREQKIKDEEITRDVCKTLTSHPF